MWGEDFAEMLRNARRTKEAEVREMILDDDAPDPEVKFSDDFAEDGECIIHGCHNTEDLAVARYENGRTSSRLCGECWEKSERDDIVEVIPIEGKDEE